MPLNNKQINEVKGLKFYNILVCTSLLCEYNVLGTDYSRKWTRAQILDQANCISHNTNTLGERYASNYSPSSYG